MKCNQFDFSNLSPAYIRLAIEWQQATPERRAAIEQKQRDMLQAKEAPADLQKVPGKQTGRRK